MGLSVNSSHFQLKDCPETKFVFTGLIGIYILFLPLFILILYMGYQQWRKQRSSSLNGITSHTDVFTYHIVILELIGILSICFYWLGIYTNEQYLIIIGTFIFFLVSAGQTLFHILMCVERYLAVVHPIIYLDLRQANGVMIRNISTGSVWLISFSVMWLAKLHPVKYGIINLVFMILSMFIVAFCSFSVLQFLIRSGPGEGGRNGEERVDLSKQRAFHTVVAIMGVLLLRLLLSLFSSIFQAVFPFDNVTCLFWFISLWFYLPCSLLSPLLFLKKAGKLPSCKKKSAGAG